MIYEMGYEISSSNHGCLHPNGRYEHGFSHGEDISDLKKLISGNEDARMNSRDLAFFLVSHNYNAAPRDDYVKLNPNGTIYKLIPNSKKPGLRDIIV